MLIGRIGEPLKNSVRVCDGLVFAAGLPLPRPKPTEKFLYRLFFKERLCPRKRPGTHKRVAPGPPAGGALPASKVKGVIGWG